jgi:protocatechuate 3,4-dioxygenase beta subunit
LKEGVPLKLRLFAHAITATACAPLSGAIVDIWHCDARGVYSDVDDPSFRTVGRKFLRGYQTTAGDGSVEFLTIYPGWYRGRTTHVHFKVRGQSEAGRDYAFTSQLYFDEATSERIYAQSPYAASGRRTRNDDDSIYRGGGKALTLTLAPDGNGYSARFDIGLRVA